MAVQDLTIHIPQEFYHQFQDRAQKRNRLAEDETLQLLATAVPDLAPLPDDLAAIACGRATVVVLNLNRSSLVRARWRLVEARWHPPAE